MDKKLRDELVAIDHALGEVQISGGLEQRILRSPSSARQPRRWPILLAAFAIVLFATAMLYRAPPTSYPDPARSVAVSETRTVEPLEPQHEDAQAQPDTVRWEGALHLEPGCEPTGGARLQIAKDCRLTLADPELEVQVLAKTHLQPAERGIRVDSGLVMVVVEHVEDANNPVRVEVMGGAIEVTGTRFLVAQGPQDGYVHLIDGSITFVPDHGDPVAATVGEPLHWNAKGVRPVAAAVPLGPTPKPPIRPQRNRVAEAPPELDPLLDKVARHRRRGQYREAVSLLRRASARAQDPQTREIMSFEEGTLVEHYKRPSAVCSFWRGHLVRFAKGRYEQAIARRLAGLECPSTPEPDPQ